jgi:hypothetical protein
MSPLDLPVRACRATHAAARPRLLIGHMSLARAGADAEAEANDAPIRYTGRRFSIIGNRNHAAHFPRRNRELLLSSRG